MAILALPDQSHQDSPPPAVPVKPGRIVAIDAVRGLLICLIAIGHGQILLNDSESNRWFSLLITKVTNLGTPAFTLISGLLLGYFECTHSDFRPVRRKYFIRGLQLLTIAHLLIATGTAPLRQEASFGEICLRYWYITDTLAILFMVLPTLIPRVCPPARILIGAVCLLSWMIASLFPPLSSPLLLVMKELSFGVSPGGNHLLEDTYPIIPLAGLFLIGTVLGNAFAGSLAGGRLERFVATLRKSVAPLMLLSGFLLGLWAWGKVHPESLWGGYLRTLFYPDKLSSLLPFYLATLFLILTHFMVKIEIRGQSGWREKFLAPIGRNSLFAYVAQYFLVQTIPSLIGWRNQLNAAEMILYLGGTLMILFYFVRAYNKLFLKRWRPANKINRKANGINIKKDVASPFNTPELLDLKKDLW